jgi:fatty acid-binding protein DegV
MKTKIVVDSSSNLYTLSGVDFACVPLKIVTDDGEYLDTAELDAVGMAQTLRSYKGKTGTSCPAKRRTGRFLPQISGCFQTPENADGRSIRPYLFVPLPPL